jgi:uncharacterized protein YlzI (FlbEa/FlbD family)
MMMSGKNLIVREEVDKKKKKILAYRNLLSPYIVQE